jgi:polysaccharide export outer membrane protein
MRFLSTRAQSAHSYRLQIGDKLKIESVTDPNINREITVQPDGNIALFLVDEVHAAGLTFQELRQKLFAVYTQKDYKPAAFQITITPTATNTRLDDLLISITNRFTAGGQSQQLKVAPDGTISLIKIGRVCVQGMSLDEVKWEVNARYSDYVDGLEVTPILTSKAPHFCFVLGEVRNPGRYSMDSPTTVSMALAMAGSWQLGGNLRQVVVFRRAEDWRLLATKLDIRGALYGKRPSPADEIFLRDSDVVPKSSIQQTDDLIELLFTRGLYRITPFGISTTFAGSGAAVTTTVGGIQ